MGTSSARWAPTGRRWRSAKGAATRYLAPEGAAAVSAAELAARYAAALGESADREGEGPLASFRLTRKVAQNLGDVWQDALEGGWEGALEKWGLQELGGSPPEILAQALSAALVGPVFNLEATVARASLALVLGKALPGNLGNLEDRLAPPIPPSSAREVALLVRQFLATALYQRLVFDLGESLEAAAGSWGRFRSGLARLQARMETAAKVEGAEPGPAPGQWGGLAGWTWVTRATEALLHHLAPQK
jgi:hypothetical protein